MLLADKVVLVTGVGVGIGRQVAAAALDAGARVVVAARTAARLEQTARQLDPTGERVFAHPVHLRSEDSCAALVAAAVQRFGTIDAFVQNAAFEDAAGGLFQLSLEKWARAFDTNMLGALRLLRAVAPVMRDHGGRERGAHRQPVGPQAVAAPVGLRRVEGRAALRLLLPRRRAGSGQHPRQHRRPVGPGAGPSPATSTARRPSRAGPATRWSASWSAGSRCAGWPTSPFAAPATLRRHRRARGAAPS